MRLIRRSITDVESGENITIPFIVISKSRAFTKAVVDVTWTLSTRATTNSSPGDRIERPQGGGGTRRWLGRRSSQPRRWRPRWICTFQISKDEYLDITIWRFGALPNLEKNQMNKVVEWKTSPFRLYQSVQVMPSNIAIVRNRYSNLVARTYSDDSRQNARAFTWAWSEQLEQA